MLMKKGDIILTVVVIAIIAFGFAFMRYYKSDGDDRVAVIKQDDMVIKRIDLDTVNEQERISIGGSYNEVILIENGRIRFEEADCPDKVCVNTGWLTKKGDVAVCLPNRTIIKIEGGKKEVDDVTF